MAAETERAEVGQVALTAAFGDGKNVIGVPQGCALPGLQAPRGPGEDAPPAADAFESEEFGAAVDPAARRCRGRA